MTHVSITSLLQETPDRQGGFLSLIGFPCYEVLHPWVSLRAAGGNRLHQGVLVHHSDLTPKSECSLFHLP